MILTDSEGKQIFGQSYQHFNSGAYDDCIKVLQPILEGASIEGWPNSRVAILWGIAGDAYIANGKINDGIKVYKRSIEIDPTSACIELYADAIASHNLKDDATHALACLDRLIDMENQCKTSWQLVAFIIGLFTTPSTIWYKAFGRSRTRRKLARLSKS